MTKEHFEGEPQAEELHEIMESNKEVSSKPVAWLMDEDLNKLQKCAVADVYRCQQFSKDSSEPKKQHPLYTHPVKQLSDDKVQNIIAIICKMTSFSPMISEAIANAIIKEITE